jgi:threonyl-tRNA synthetase
VQVRLLPVSDAQRDYANQVAQTLQQEGFRVEVDTSGERLGKQMRIAESVGLLKKYRLHGCQGF